MSIFTILHEYIISWFDGIKVIYPNYIWLIDRLFFTLGFVATLLFCCSLIWAILSIFRWR